MTDEAKARPAAPTADAVAEQLARIERVLWSTAVAHEVEPWVTPQWHAADAARPAKEVDRGQR